MNLNTKVYTSILFLFLSLGINKLDAQKSGAPKTDTTSTPVDSSKFITSTEIAFPYGSNGDLIVLSNNLNSFQNYHERNLNTGNIGSAEKNFQIPLVSNSKFKTRPETFGFFGHQPDNRMFYFSKKPYTNIQFILGQKQELNVHVIHAHQFGKNCNVAFDFNRIRSTGFYQRQSTNNTSVDLDGWFRSPSNRYLLLADFYWKGTDDQENGGIKNDSDFEYATLLDRKIVDINLTDAETRQRQRGAWIKQYWSFGAIIDTLTSLSDSTLIRTKISPSWAIVHTIEISDKKYIYSDRDPLSGFYQNVLLDTNITNDSTYHWKLENGVWLELFQFRNRVQERSLYGKAGIKNETGEIFQDSIYSSFTNWMLDGSLSYNNRNEKSKKYFTGVNVLGSYVVLGYNRNDYVLKAVAGKKNKYEISAAQKKQSPDFIYSHYSGNHYTWLNNFYSSTQTDVFGTWMQPLGKNNTIAVTGGMQLFQDPIYFNENSIPEQFLGTVQNLSARVHLTLGTKIVKSITDFSWNKLPDQSVLRIPEFLIRESIFGDFKLFKKALQMQTGVDAFWYSSYFGDTYNPNLSQFYLQNIKKTGNYLYLSPWVSIKVKSVRIFVKADHVNAGLMGRNYYLIPHYPQNDFALKFGLSWVFND